MIPFTKRLRNYAALITTLQQLRYKDILFGKDFETSLSGIALKGFDVNEIQKRCAWQPSELSALRTEFFSYIDKWAEPKLGVDEHRFFNGTFFASMPSITISETGVNVPSWNAGTIYDPGSGFPTTVVVGSHGNYGFHHVVNGIDCVDNSICYHYNAGICNKRIPDGIDFIADYNSVTYTSGASSIVLPWGSVPNGKGGTGLGCCGFQYPQELLDLLGPAEYINNNGTMLPRLPYNRVIRDTGTFTDYGFYTNSTGTFAFPYIGTGSSAIPYYGLGNTVAVAGTKRLFISTTHQLHTVLPVPNIPVIPDIVTDDLKKLGVSSVKIVFRGYKASGGYQTYTFTVVRMHSSINGYEVVCEEDVVIDPLYVATNGSTFTVQNIAYLAIDFGTGNTSRFNYYLSNPLNWTAIAKYGSSYRGEVCGYYFIGDSRNEDYPLASNRAAALRATPDYKRLKADPSINEYTLIDKIILGFEYQGLNSYPAVTDNSIPPLIGYGGYHLIEDDGAVVRHGSLTSIKGISAASELYRVYLPCSTLMSATPRTLTRDEQTNDKPNKLYPDALNGLGGGYQIQILPSVQADIAWPTYFSDRYGGGPPSSDPDLCGSSGLQLLSRAPIDLANSDGLDISSGYMYLIYSDPNNTSTIQTGFTVTSTQIPNYGPYWATVTPRGKTYWQFGSVSYVSFAAPMSYSVIQGHPDDLNRPSVTGRLYWYWDTGITIGESPTISYTQTGTRTRSRVSIGTGTMLNASLNLPTWLLVESYYTVNNMLCRSTTEQRSVRVCEKGKSYRLHHIASKSQNSLNIKSLNGTGTIVNGVYTPTRCGEDTLYGFVDEDGPLGAMDVIVIFNDPWYFIFDTGQGASLAPALTPLSNTPGVYNNPGFAQVSPINALSTDWVFTNPSGGDRALYTFKYQGKLVQSIQLTTVKKTLTGVSKIVNVFQGTADSAKLVFGVTEKEIADRPLSIALIESRSYITGGLPTSWSPDRYNRVITVPVTSSNGVVSATITADMVSTFRGKLFQVLLIDETTQIMAILVRFNADGSLLAIGG